MCDCEVRATELIRKKGSLLVEVHVDVKWKIYIMNVYYYIAVCVYQQGVTGCQIRMVAVDNDRNSRLECGPNRKKSV